MSRYLIGPIVHWMIIPMNGSSLIDCSEEWKPIPGWQAENAINSKIPRDNRSGIKGVYWHKRDGKWVARLGSRYIGSCFDKDAAAAAYRDADIAAFGGFAMEAC